MHRYRFAALLLAFSITAPLRAAIELPPADKFAAPAIQQPIIKSTKALSVKDFGATGDGKTNDTAAINKAIDKLAEGGGGTLNFPAGKYLVASVHLKSNMQFVLDKDAEIIGAKDGYDAREPSPFNAYQDTGHDHYHDSVMCGEDLENFAIIGGKVNGGGTTQSDNYPNGASGGNKVIAIKRGKNFLFKDVTHETAHFVYLLNDCENLTFSKVVIKKSRDAIDFMGCRNIAVSECHFTGCSDDTIGLKSDYVLGKRILTENVWVWNNYFESGCNGLQFGSETAGDFRNIWFWNIQINLGMKSGIGITSNDSANIEDVHYKDIKVKNAAVPIFILITDRLRTGEKDVKPGSIKNVTFQNIEVSEVVAGKNHGPANCATISGRPDAIIDGILFDNVKITYKGNTGDAKADEKPEEVNNVPKLPKEDYSPNAMGRRPASAWFIRYAKNITFRNCDVSFEHEWVKPPVVVWNVDGLTFEKMKVPTKPGLDTLRFKDVTNVNVVDSPEIDAAVKK